VEVIYILLIGLVYLLKNNDSNALISFLSNFFDHVHSLSDLFYFLINESETDKAIPSLS
jgi:hypothetical protein